MKKLIVKRIGQTAAAIAFLLALWALAYFCVGNELLVPSLSDSFFSLGDLLGNSRFWGSFSYSLLRAVEAFGISLLAAGIFAVVAYLLPSLSAFFAPVVAALRSLPAVAALLVLWVVLGAARAPVAVAFLSLFPMLYTAILSALKSVDRQIIEVARVQGTPVYRRIFALYLPLISPSLLREGGGALAFSLKLVVSAEALAGTTKSLGRLLLEAKAYSELPTLFALVVVAFVVGLAIELFFNGLAALAEGKIR